MPQESAESNGQDPVPGLRFRPVTTKTLGDLASFRLSHRTFGSCSCMRWRMRRTEFSRTTKSVRCVAFDGLVAAGIPVGVLGYVDDVPIGWCSIAPIESFAGLDGQASADARNEEHVWAVTCFYVDYRHRRQGVALHLLRAAVEYAWAEGAKVIEGYPNESAHHPHGFMGTPAVFRRAGFREATPPGKKKRVMRNIVG